MNIHTIFTPVLLWTVLLLAALGSGCGFHLRGEAEARELPADVSPMLISGLATFNELRRDLAQALERSDVALTTKKSESASVLNISDRASEQRLLSVDSRNKALEYEIEESFQFSLHRKDGTELAAPQRLRTLRIVPVPANEVLGRSREAQMQRRDMRRELASRMIDRLATQLK